MISKKKLANLSALTIFLITSACGSYPEVAPIPPIYQTAMTQNTNDCCCCCNDNSSNDNNSSDSNNSSNNSNSNNNSSNSNNNSSNNNNNSGNSNNSSNSSSNGNNINSGNNNTSNSNDNNSTASKGRKALDKVMEYISVAKTIESEVDKFEKSINDPSKTTQQTLKVYTRKSPQQQVKLEIISHSKPSNVGAKVLYTSGSGKALVRPGGALSFITKEFAQNDDAITSPNNYTPESCDFFSMVKRLSNPDYSAEITGKATMEVVKKYI
ncbi:MAG: hypothetical protein KatS3mg068_0390 [Candidatus Sericytochromatia bacterium]|nr:MAG: hypothetical protein KatS3mg068_0390 [Candidatus Sericytochromatia bacterium]